MPKNFPFIFTTIAFLLLEKPAQAHPTMGVDIANAALESLILSAPFPSLDGGQNEVTPQYGTIQTELINKPGVTDTTTPVANYSGVSKGQSAGFGLTFPSKKDLSYFFYVTGSSQTGEFNITYDSAATVRYTDFKASGAAAFAAAQYRLVGDAKSTFALGVFGGPGYYSFQSSLNYDQVGSGPTPSDVKFDPSGIGVLTGLQMVFRVGKFRINPYFLVFNGIGDACHKVSLTGGQLGDSSFKCGGNDGYAAVPPGFGGLGLALGYQALRFNVWSFQPANDIRPLKVTSYTVSYGFEF
ncbi:hypothetical protein [Bdellovibrio sp. HCB337]|uniref:hypothetical protein n=1 Tax=Bdellovibrio sp. HCB337 TaxID=3394358 RepID=UPI0039A6E294